MNKRHYEHTLPNIRGSLSNTYILTNKKGINLPFFPSKKAYLSFFSWCTPKSTISYCTVKLIN